MVRRHGAAGVPMFNDVEEMAEAAGLLARYPGCAMRRATVCPACFPRPKRRDKPEKV
jgi:hypothetical protein